MKLALLFLLALILSASAQRIEQHARPTNHLSKVTRFPTAAKQYYEAMIALGEKPVESKINTLYEKLCKEKITLTPEHLLVADRIGFARFKKLGFDPENVTDIPLKAEIKRLRSFYERKKQPQKVIVLPTRGYKPLTEPLPGGKRLPKHLWPKPPLPKQ